MFDRFLVPLDGSKFAEKAAITAGELARRCQAELIFLSVCPTKEAVKDAVKYLHHMSEAARRETLNVRAEALIGAEPAPKIVEVAHYESVDLIIMSSHGRTGISRTVFGSVAETVMRNSSCPVMVVKHSEPKIPLTKFALAGA